jgi:hypothetical protein
MSVSLVASNSCASTNAYGEWQTTDMVDGYRCHITYDELVYPNPASEQLTVQFSAAKGAKSVCVYDKNQVKVMEQEVKDEDHFVLPILNLPDGLYMIQIKEGELYTTKRVLIKRN